jgi:hypothetical protein
MNEGDKATGRTDPWFFVNQPHAFGFQILQSRANVFDADGDVMDATTRLSRNFEMGSQARWVPATPNPIRLAATCKRALFGLLLLQCAWSAIRADRPKRLLPRPVQSWRFQCDESS